MPEFSANEWDQIGHSIKEDKELRAGRSKRRELEQRWAQIDRQIAMVPVERRLDSGSEDAWMPNTEWPTQFNTLEVVMADARGMVFPKGRNWYTPASYLSEDYLERFEKRRDRFPLIGKETAPLILDQDTADTLVKATLDHFHTLYNFRAMNDFLRGEEIKYGTSDCVVRETVHPHFDADSRGRDMRGPAVVPFSIKNTYLDDSPAAVLREGFKKRGTVIRKSYRHLEDLKRAAMAGGESRGWRVAVVSNLEGENEKDEYSGQIEVLVSDGDHFLEGRWLPNTRITVAVGKNDRRVIRFEEDQDNEHVHGYYLRDDVNSPYASSPLMKGAPIQQAISEGMNRMMMAAVLEAEPPVVWDRYDSTLAANGGPDLGPGAKNGVENLDSIKKIFDLNPEALMAVVQFLIKTYEDVTGNTDPRRGAETKSHTTAFAKDVESARGQVRTEDYVADIQQGSMTTILHKEYRIIKRVLKTPQPIFVNANGIKGWVKVSAADLPDQVSFEVHGALGPLAERENIDAKNQAFTNIIAIHMQAAQLQAAGINVNLPELDMEAIEKEIAQDAGINDAERFIRSAKSAPRGVQEQPGVQGANGAALPGGAQAAALPPR